MRDIRQTGMLPLPKTRAEDEEAPQVQRKRGVNTLPHGFTGKPHSWPPARVATCKSGRSERAFSGWFSSPPSLFSSTPFVQHPLITAFLPYWKPQ